MREPLRDRERLQHILAAIDRVQRYTNGKTYEELVGNDMMYYAAMVKAARSAAIAVERATQKQLRVVAAVATLLAGSVMVQASALTVAALVSVLGVAARDGRQEGTNASNAEGILPTASVRLAGGMAVVRSAVETGSYSFR
jgi:hypothetical protein